MANMAKHYPDFIKMECPNLNLCGVNLGLLGNFLTRVYADYWKSGACKPEEACLALDRYLGDLTEAFERPN